MGTIELVQPKNLNPETSRLRDNVQTFDTKGSSPEAERKHILVLSMQVPNVPDSGGPTRSWYFVKALAEQHDVTLACLSSGQVKPELAELCKSVIEVEACLLYTSPNPRDS